MSEPDGGPAVLVIGAGLAGSEAAWQLARRGHPVELREMRPETMTPAHHTARAAELVCTNSFKSDLPQVAAGLLKEEMRRLGSLVLTAADAARVPSGQDLSVDRDRFSAGVEAGLDAAGVRRTAGEVTALDPQRWTIVDGDGTMRRCHFIADPIGNQLLQRRANSSVQVSALPNQQALVRHFLSQRVLEDVLQVRVAPELEDELLALEMIQIGLQTGGPLRKPEQDAVLEDAPDDRRLLHAPAGLGREPVEPGH